MRYSIYHLSQSRTLGSFNQNIRVYVGLKLLITHTWNTFFPCFPISLCRSLFYGLSNQYSKNLVHFDAPHPPLLYKASGQLKSQKMPSFTRSMKVRELMLERSEEDMCDIVYPWATLQRSTSQRTPRICPFIVKNFVINPRKTCVSFKTSMKCS